MRIEKNDTDTSIFLTKEEVMELCRPGEGDNTCVWVVVGPEGFECTYYNKPVALLERWVEGQTNAKRNGCDKVKSLNLSLGYEKSRTLQDLSDEKNK